MSGGDVSRMGVGGISNLQSNDIRHLEWIPMALTSFWQAPFEVRHWLPDAKGSLSGQAQRWNSGLVLVSGSGLCIGWRSGAMVSGTNGHGDWQRGDIHLLVGSVLEE